MWVMISEIMLKSKVSNVSCNCSAKRNFCCNGWAALLQPLALLAGFV